MWCRLLWCSARDCPHTIICYWRIKRRKFTNRRVPPSITDHHFYRLSRASSSQTQSLMGRALCGIIKVNNCDQIMANSNNKENNPESEITRAEILRTYQTTFEQARSCLNKSEATILSRVLHRFSQFTPMNSLRQCESSSDTDTTS